MMQPLVFTTLQQSQAVLCTNSCRVKLMNSHLNSHKCVFRRRLHLYAH